PAGARTLVDAVPGCRGVARRPRAVGFASRLCRGAGVAAAHASAASGGGGEAGGGQSRLAAFAGTRLRASRGFSGRTDRGDGAPRFASGRLLAHAAATAPARPSRGP